MKYIVVLGDGMADRPIPALGGKTPLEAAAKPHMDAIARKGLCGMVKTIPEGMPPGSDVANLSVMGYAPKIYYSGRSPLEAVSMGVDLHPEDVAIRCNLVCVSDEAEYEDKTMVDYSSDEISTEEARELVAFIKEQVGEAVESVKVSRKLKNHAVCLSAEGEITLEMERYFHTLPGVDANAMRARRVLEINADHAAIQALDAARENDRERAANMAKVLLAQAELVAGMMPEDPAAYSDLVCSLF